MKFNKVAFLSELLTSRGFVLFFCVGIMAFSISAQTNPRPFHCFPHQNIKCSDLNAMNTDPRYSHITENWEFKIDSSNGLPNGTYPFSSGGVREILGGGPEDPTKSLFISTANNFARINSFSSQKSILAVILKVGTDSYVYSYNPPVSSDSNLITNDNRELSHVSFCFGLSLNPSAANATVSGRVVDSSGRGISRARISITAASTNVVTTVITNPFGYYTISNLESTDFYYMSVSHKRYSFSNNLLSFTLNEDLSGADFVANP